MHPPGPIIGMARSPDPANKTAVHHQPPAPDYFTLKTKSNDPESKRKTWGERWRFNKAPKQGETMEMHSQFMVHPEYARKYGTISPGVLSRSVKYAETWLYGTVGGRGAVPQRPSLFLYPGMTSSSSSSTPAPRPVRIVCHCPGTLRDAVCRQCGVRRPRPRQTLLAATSQDEPKAIPTATDPYNLMRKSRLGVGETTETSILNPKTKQKKRTRSSSPLTRKSATPSFETFKPAKTERLLWVADSHAWESDNSDDNDENTKGDLRPKSILDCNVSAYDLYKKLDSSDELSDGTNINSKMKILRPKLKKTDMKNKKKITIPEPKKLPDHQVRLSGQRFRIFDHSTTTPTMENNGYISDKEILDDTPKRPPRKPKASGLRLSKLKSISSPNLSIKSILKKPIDDDESEDEISIIETPKLYEKMTKKQTQSTLKKKKQVQFRVTTILQKSEEPTTTESCLVESVDSTIISEQVSNGNELPAVDRKSDQDSCIPNDDAIARIIEGQEEITGCSSLKRSLSDRRPSSAVVKYGQELLEVSTSPPNSFLFSDTMALRPRIARHDSRELFLDQKNRPKEPPPPPPPSTNNLMSYAEFSKLIDQEKKNVKPVLPPPDPPPRLPIPKNRSDAAHRVTFDNVIPPAPVKLCDHCESGIITARSKDEMQKKTIVTITPNDAKRTSIIINGKNTTENEPLGKRTSVIINNFQSQDCNKVTISVRNNEEEKEEKEEESTTSSSTIIETGSQSTVIPVVSTDNKTLLVVDGSSTITNKPEPYIFNNSTLLDHMDPVEAVRRNLVPHVCGKEETTKDESLKQLSKLFNHAVNAQQEPSGQPAESLVSAYQARKIAQWKLRAQETTLSTTSPSTSRSNSFCGSAKTPSSRNTSRSNSFNDCPLSVSQSKFYVASDSDETITQELDKLEDEYVIRNGLERKDDNIYETIKEPIYDQVGFKIKAEESDEDIPPPLPTTLPPSLDEIQHGTSKSIFEGASKYDILSYLVDAKDRVQEDLYLVEHRRMESLDGSEMSEISKSSDSGVDAGPASTSSDSSEDSLLQLDRKTCVEIERNDSGVGSETSQSSRSKWQLSSIKDHLCEDCDEIVETQITDSGVMYAPLICRKCSKRRNERKEIIQEIVETEEKYSRDLRIILEEFYKPMLVAGLLTPDQLSAIFLNVEELMDNSEALSEKLKDSLDIALEQGDDDLLTVNIGRLFLDTKPMLHAFESYCTRQASAAVLLANLEKEKELLRIFLRVSQMENTVLRRMNLNSFLMVPVQRVTKYPLLLARLYKVTPLHHDCRQQLKEAQHNVELHLEHMNAEAKDGGSARVWRRFSTTSTVRKSAAELELTSIKIRKLAVDLLEWSHDEVRFVLEGRLLFAQPDGNWKRGRTVKLQPIFALLATLGKPNNKYRSDFDSGSLAFPCKTGIREATLLLIKEKCGRFTLIREPLYLDKLIICCEPDAEDLLEVQELSTKDSYLFKAEDTDRTKEWYRQLQYHAQILGGWRRRRNALANIMITGMSYGG